MRIFEASAPGRCGIIGNPSDIYGGVVVSCSIPARARCRLEVAQASSPVNNSLKEELVIGETPMLHPSARIPEDRRLWDAAVRRIAAMGCTIQEVLTGDWSTDIPRSNGLSGSTALLAATLSCLLAACGDESLLHNETEFAELIRDVERNDAGIMCGYQDAYMIAYGGLQRMDFAGKHPVEPGPPAKVESIAAALPFLLITTGVERLSGAVHGPMSERWLCGERAVVDSMKRIAELGALGADALRTAEWTELAKLMSENHAIMKGLGGSGEEVDRLISACLERGAMAAKLAGAGMGGTVIALTQAPDDLEAKLRMAGYSRFMRPAIAPGAMLEKAT